MKLLRVDKGHSPRFWLSSHSSWIDSRVWGSAAATILPWNYSPQALVCWKIDSLQASLQQARLIRPSSSNQGRNRLGYFSLSQLLRHSTLSASYYLHFMPIQWWPPIPNRTQNRWLPLPNSTFPWNFQVNLHCHRVLSFRLPYPLNWEALDCSNLAATRRPILSESSYFLNQFQSWRLVPPKATLQPAMRTYCQICSTLKWRLLQRKC